MVINGRSKHRAITKSAPFSRDSAALAVQEIGAQHRPKWRLPTNSRRSDIVTVEDGSLILTLSTPKALGGAGGEGTNPEQLFAAGYAACFLSAVRFVAGGRKLKIADEANVSARCDGSSATVAGRSGGGEISPPPPLLGRGDAIALTSTFMPALMRWSRLVGSSRSHGH